MSEELSFTSVCGDGSAAFDLIFIHGLTGDAKETWASKNPKNEDIYWPNWFCSDFPTIRVHTLGYPASVFGKWAKKEMTLYERAENALESLVTHQIGKRPLGFITHSLGGLLAKQILRTANETNDDDWKAVVTSTKLVAFLATPHSGASLAGLLKQYAKPITSNHIAALSNDCGQLDDLNNSYREIAPTYSIKTVAYYEKFKTNNILLVDQHSANPGTSGTRPIALDSDHIDICKPKSSDALIYQSIRRHLSKVVPSQKFSAASFGYPDYGQAHESDRRDLLQKLIDAGREHQYQSAREQQNAFAQNYYRLGLHTDAKNLHDEMLSEIEQRFNLHVYENHICKKSADDQIAKTIQEQVVDPICLKYKAHRLPATEVIRAIYFLTQQCHIKWDHK